MLVSGPAAVYDRLRAATEPRPICIGNTRYEITFDGTFAPFRRYERGSGTWETAFPWGRTNPGARDAALYVDRDFAVGGGPPLGLDPFSLSDGALAITASAPPAELHVLDPPPAAISGVVTTRHAFFQRYGYFEARIRMPRGRGLWPAFWMLPTMGYPPEIDVVEVLGHAPARIYQTTHGRAKGSGRQVVWNGTDASDGFHVYAVEWTSAAITFFVDGHLTGTVPNVSDQPMYLLANLQVGAPGSWPGAPDASTPFPATMLIDYVRAYRSAGTCATSSRGAPAAGGSAAARTDVAK
ncbi:MAG TPA: glycoside hydrolase family 16 protein [Candidatus Elarobacter sp.]